MLTRCYLAGVFLMLGCSVGFASNGSWQPAIWTLFFLSVFQNMVTQFKVLEK